MMKRLFLSLIFVLNLMQNCFSMEKEVPQPNDAQNAIRNGLKGGFKNVFNGAAVAAESLSQMRMHLTKKEDKRIEDLQYRLYHSYSKEEREEIEKEILEVRKRKEGREAVYDDHEDKLYSLVPELLNASKGIAEKEEENRLQLANKWVEWQAKKEESIEKTKQYIEALKDPKNAKLFALTGTAIAFGLCGAWHGTKILAKVVQKYLHKVPAIAEETSLISIKERMVNYLFGRKPESDINEVILEEKLTERVNEIASSVKNTVANGGFFQHLLFHGLSGTGKTMLAKRIARSSGLEYIYFAGGSALEQLEIEDALSQLTELFEFAKKSSKRLMIIIDEAEVLLADRRKNLNDKTRKLLNLILGYTGEEQDKFVIVALTNRPQDLDDAFLSRCDEQIEIGAPGPEERLRILELYVNKFLVSRVKTQSKPSKPSLFARIFGRQVASKGLSIQKDVFNKNTLAAIAQKLDGFVGRDISKLVISIQSMAYASPNGCVTPKMVDAVVKQKIEQKRREELLAKQREAKK